MGLILITGKDKERPNYEPRYLKQIKDYDPELDIYWHEEYERWGLRRKAEGKWHHCFFVNNDDGSYRPIDDRLIEEIWQCDLWRHFGNDEEAGRKLHAFIQAKRAEANLKEKNLRHEYLEWYNKEHKKDWEVTFENFKRGKLNDNEI